MPAISMRQDEDGKKPAFTVRFPTPVLAGSGSKGVSHLPRDSTQHPVYSANFGEKPAGRTPSDAVKVR